LDKYKGELKSGSPCCAVERAKPKVLLNMFDSFCRLRKGYALTEDTIKLPCRGILWAECFDSLAVKWMILIEPFRRSEEIFEGRQVLIVDGLD